ncbi:MAG: hypothetical protein ABIZ80_18765, partial [Bryobacteraceae bacterium]
MSAKLLSLGLSIVSLVAAAPTFTKDIAPIFNKRCVACHRPNDIAPMSLLDYKSVRPWAKAIREAVLTGKMPPWFADPRFGHFSNDARLTAGELASIKAWADQGAPEGNPKDLPPAPVFVEGWRLGKPDAVVDIGEDFKITPGLDAYEHFTVATNFTEGKWIRAAEILPGNRRVVHHVHVNLVRDGSEAGPTTVQGMSSLSSFLVKEGKLTRVRED